MKKDIRIVCISDTHGRHKKLKIPEGDILIHAGDITNMGALDEVIKFNKFLGTLPHPHKIIIAGNHDFAFEYSPEETQAVITNAIYLQDQEVTIEGVRIYGSPWQPRFHDWAFNLDRGAAIREKWDLIPEGLDILVTHGPAFGQGDIVNDGGHAGCEDLFLAIKRTQPKFHVFGHIHGGYGIFESEKTTFINASSCDEDYRPINKPILFDISIED